MHVVAPEISEELQSRAPQSDRLRLTCARFDQQHYGDALLVVVATNDDATNARIASEASAMGRLVNVASAPERGNCVTPAVHRANGVTIAVSADRVPSAAARIRDRIAGIVDSRYAAAVRELSSLRATLLGASQRERWTAANEALIGDDFCRSVESGDFVAKVAAWR